jgi:multicomponent Na+:H+ antiporter subunit G
MWIAGYVFLITGLVFIVLGTLRAILAHTMIGTLHFLTIADTVGLILVVVAAFFFNCLSVLEMIAFIVAIMITAPLVTHVIARSFVDSKGHE